MQFLLQYASGAVLWKSYDRDLFQTVPYEDYCRSRAYLFPLLYTVKAAASAMAGLRKDPITSVEPGVSIFVDLRYWGFLWYEELNLPVRQSKFSSKILRFFKLVIQRGEG